VKRTTAGRLLPLALALTCFASVPPAAATGPMPLAPGVQHVELLVEPDDGLGALTGAIRAANRSIRLTMYILTDHSVIRALEFAHAVGVDVRVILEQHPYGANSSTNLFAYNNLMAADIPVRWSSARYLLTHEKSMLIDGSTAYIMTTNFTRAAFHANREFDVIDRDRREASALDALFAADWAGRPYTPADPNLVTSPSNARAALGALIASARRSLDIYAEELQDGGMVRALAGAARHGVRVRLLLPAPAGPDPDGPAVAAAAAAGVAVHRLAQTQLYIHAKAIMVDSARAFVGSQNLSTASLDRNRELGVLLSDRRAVARLERTFATDWRRPTASSP
jgi:phosphatidylserine/phosphatidylglycerophosphate/cardiolipin synthase-like enzyme